MFVAGAKKTDEVGDMLGNLILVEVGVRFGFYSRFHREPWEVLSIRATGPALHFEKHRLQNEDRIVVGAKAEGGRQLGGTRA